MQLSNDTMLELGFVAGEGPVDGCALTLIAKGTFRLAPGEVAAAVPETDRLPLSGDEPQGDAPRPSIRYDSDFAPFKPRTDLLLVGSCHTPEGEPLEQCRTTFAVGDKSRSLEVFGDRQWQPRRLGRFSLSRPRLFRRMALCWERSFGGETYWENPAGVGFRPDRHASEEAMTLPNLEDPEALIRSPRDCPLPANLGPVPRTWALRTRKLGTHDHEWLVTRSRWRPNDFDWSYFNAAPPGLQLDTYLRGDEALRLENLHPEHTRLRCRLPGLRARCFLRRSGAVRPGWHEVAMHLDTLWVDAEAEILVLLWRGVTTVRTPDHDEVEEALLVTENLEDRESPVEHYTRGETANVAVTASAAPAPARNDSAAAPPPAPLPQAESPETRNAYDTFERAGMNLGVLLGSSATVLTPRRFGARLYSQHREASLIRSTLRNPPAGSKNDQVLTDLGVDPALANQPPPRPESAGERAAAERESAAKEPPPGADAAGPAADRSYAGRDLAGRDFSGRRLANADFRDADLTGASFAGADLQDANFSRANLAGATLAGADLRGADFRAANLEDADLSACQLTDARLGDARLVSASLEGARGIGVDAAGADLTGVRAAGAMLPEASLARVSAAGSFWSEADLTAADLSCADLPGADLRRTVLRRSVLRAADCQQTLASGADLSEVDARQANLFRAILDEARLEQADLRGANLFAAELALARFYRADLRGANLGRTRLAATQ